jgi:hypothetical protein
MQQQKYVKNMTFLSHDCGRNVATVTEFRKRLVLYQKVSPAEVLTQYSQVWDIGSSRTKGLPDIAIFRISEYYTQYVS